MRYFIEVAYYGGAFHGWQIQSNATSVQERLEFCFSKMLREPINIVGSGRTDTGVHCQQQYAHFDTSNSKIVESSHFLFKINSFLQKNIAIRQIYKVKEDAHARFDAYQRTYQYFFRTKKSPFSQGLEVDVHHNQLPDLDLMNQAGEILCSYEDFESFSKIHTEVNHFRCDIHYAKWTPTAEGFYFEVSANRFLRGMVRTLVGTMMDIGTKKTSLSDFSKIIEAKDRAVAGAAAPAHGLYLTEVKYPKGFLNNPISYIY